MYTAVVQKLSNYAPDDIIASILQLEDKNAIFRVDVKNSRNWEREGERGGEGILYAWSCVRFVRMIYDILMRILHKLHGGLMLNLLTGIIRNWKSYSNFEEENMNICN